MRRKVRLLLLLALVVGPACGSRRLAGYLEELENCACSSSGSSGVSDASDASEAGSGGSESGSSGASGGTTGGSETTTASGGMTSTGFTTTSETTDSSTGEPMAQCGNGVLEAFGLVPEECDDGNLDALDGCDDACAREVRVFVTSVSYQGSEIGGLYLADALCGNLADDQGWPDAITYRAWLSDSKTDARDRFKRGRGPLVMVNGLVFADSWSALLAGDLQNPLEVTEKSETYHDAVWTGTLPDGTAVPGAEHCADWTSDSPLKTGHYGESDRTTPEWTMSVLDDNPSACFISYALYCMQTL